MVRILSVVMAVYQFSAGTDEVGDIGSIFLDSGSKLLHLRTWNTSTASRNSWMTCIHSISLWRELLVRRCMTSLGLSKCLHVSSGLTSTIY